MRSRWSRHIFAGSPAPLFLARGCCFGGFNYEAIILRRLEPEPTKMLTKLEPGAAQKHQKIGPGALLQP
jgi:hypothetical protein